jgi:hypothetical protein
MTKSLANLVQIRNRAAVVQLPLDSSLFDGATARVTLDEVAGHPDDSPMSYQQCGGTVDDEQAPVQPSRCDVSALSTAESREISHLAGGWRRGQPPRRR